MQETKPWPLDREILNHSTIKEREMTTKLNCWEYKNCGREPGGAHASDLGICPAATDSTHNGVNHGVNAGRVCWASAGTLCGGQVQGIFALKFRACQSCDFFSKVQEEENAPYSQMIRQGYRLG